MILLLAFVAWVRAASSSGPHTDAVTPCDGIYEGTPPEDRSDVPIVAAYEAALQHLNIEDVKADVVELLTRSKACWPADFGNYGPLFIRLAWHCSGSYRRSDGKGGCGGGRQRFEPERSWDDNTNLDKARALLYPLKRKYGDGLSWGDLFIAAGTMALRSMGTPIKQLCFGRIDEPSGVESLALGPSPEQIAVAPCPINGHCKEPLGSTTIGLIYLNPEGPVGGDGKPNPDPALSAKDIRDAFGRMGHSDRATVALIGGGHAFGKTHGACPAGAGLSPREAYNMTPPTTFWSGRCGTGVGKDAFTSGFEGPWTTNPTKWDNEYFKVLLENKWEKHVGPGGHWQWRIKHATCPSLSRLMRLTSDMALLEDKKYLQIVQEFAANPTALDEAFDDAWFNLTTTNGNTWSKAAKCDEGPFPEALRSSPTMLSSDIVVPRYAKWWFGLRGA